MSTDDRDPPSTATMLQTALVSTQFLSPERQHWSALAKDSPQEIEILAEQVAITGYQLYMVEQWYGLWS